MLDVRTDILSLTEFKRHTASLVERIKQTRHPLVLTVNGRTEAVVLDPETYQGLVDSSDRAEAIIGIQRGLDSFARGEGLPAREALAALRAKRAIPG